MPISLQTMYSPQKDSPSTITAGEITPSDTLVTVQSAAVLPQTVPYPLTLGVDKTITETVLVTAVSGNQLTIQRGFYGQALSWIAGTKVARVLNAADISALQENIHTVSDGVTAEQERASQSEQELANSIEAEQSARQDADSELVDLLTDEADRAANAETAISQSVASEKSRAEDAELALSQAISTEKSRATAAENALSEDAQTLSSEMAAEIESRQTADTELLGVIDAEADRTVAAESALTQSIATEKARAEGAENTLGGRLSDTENDISELQQTVGDFPETYIPQSQKGVPNGVASLNGQGIVPESQLPPPNDMGAGFAFSQNDNVTIRAGEFPNAGAGWNSFAFPDGMEFDGIPIVNARLKDTDGFVNIRNVTTAGFQYQVRLPGINYSPTVTTGTFYTASGTSATSTHSAQVLVTGISGGSASYAGTTTSSAIVISWVAVYDDSY